MRKKLAFLFTPWFMGVLFMLFALSMAVATFIENDFGAQVARKGIYNAKWFELIMILMVVNLIGQVFRYKLYKKKKITMLLFHFAFVVMIIGAGITRYIGYEGNIHIREGETQNICYSQEQFVSFSVNNERGNELFNESEKLVVTAVSSDSYSEETEIDGIDYSLEFVKYLPNAIEKIIPFPNGKPIVSLLVSRGKLGSRNVILSKGESFKNNSLNISFNEQDSAELMVSFKTDSFYLSASDVISEISMMVKGAINHPKNTILPLTTRKIYDYRGWRIVVQELVPSGVAAPVSLSHHVQQTGRNALQFDLIYGNKSTNLFVWEGDNSPAEFKTGNHVVRVNYGSKPFKLPFELKLNDFIVERYPGSNSPSSYKSDILLIDKKSGVETPCLIYMNNILKYRGYRFYQSQYDKDERGTILSVNHDNAGMLVTYAGYFLLFLFIIVSMVNKNSFFRTVNERFWSSAGKKAAIILLFLMAGSVFSYGNQQSNSIDKKKADEFGEILVQDQKGRTKPLFTLSNDILRKVSRQTEYEGYSSTQIFLGLYYNFAHWKDVPLIKVSNAEVKRLIGIRGNYAAFTDVVDLGSNTYKLGKQINDAYAKAPGARNKFDKGIMKLDERVNICYMISKGEFLKIFPLNNESDMWGTAKEAAKNAANEKDSLYVQNILNMYFEAVLLGSSDGNYEKADEYLKSIKDYQNKYTKYTLPSEKKIKTETFYYKAQIFEKLFPYYALLGVVLLLILITQIIKGKKFASIFISIISSLLFLGLISHTIGLAIRWYISGHAPMSNGYESMIFISWVTILAGFIFSKKSKLALAATAVLSSLTLMVAHLSFMDPEITNLVPVLKSYWLTLHVSVITGSYGFLGLGAIVGLIVLILYSLSNTENKERISIAIKELSILNYRNLTIGLYLLTIGTFLGAVWANESWGRYWGWDPKETWSLITIIVYSFVIHSKMITTFKNIYIFNFLSLFAFSSVLMTYFGVNYYLSGLHSYASGDSVPIPTFVYVSVASVVALAIFAHRQYNKNF